MDKNDKLGTFVRCFWASGGVSDFPEECWDQLVLCVKGGREPGTSQAQLLTMQTCAGVCTVFRTDSVFMVQLSEPEARRQAYEREQLWEEVEKDLESPRWK
jgi:hypothetical protein